MAESFHNAGYRTAAFVSAEPVRRQTGLSRGFDIYDDSGQRRSTLDTVEPAERRGGDTLAAARSWLAAGADGASKIFLWVHFYDPHFPYAPPVVKNRPVPASPYIGEIEYVDALVGQLYGELAGRCLPGATRIALIGDHGESLGEHGEATHGMALYDATLTVPLILSPAPTGVKPPGAFMPSLIDVAPTLRAWAGLPSEPADGVSLLSPQPALPRWLYAEALSPSYAFGVSPAYALRRGPWVALLHGSPEAYETASDPAQTHDLAAGTGKNFLLVAASELGKRLAAAGAEAPETPDGETLRRLRSLGYLGGATAKPLTDWKHDDRNQFIRRFAEMNASRSAFMQGRLPAARQGYEKFLHDYPAAAQAHQELGVVLIRLGEVESATRELERALQLDPGDAVTLLSMGNLRAMRGDNAGAAQFYERSLASDSSQPEALLNYANLLIATNRKADALPLLQRFLELAPRDPEAPRLRKILAEAAVQAQ